MGEAKRWWVTTPFYAVVEPILEDGSGPTYSECDTVAVWARTKREAKVKARPLLKKIRGGWMEDVDGNPFVGLKVELHECQHIIDDGQGPFDDGAWCDKCQDRWDEECRRMDEEELANA